MGAAKATQSRRLVLDILLECEKQGAKSTDIIKAVLDKNDFLEQRDKAFIRHLAEGCVERAITLDHVIDSFASTKTSKMKTPVKLIMRMGVYQILYMDSVPDSAACNEAVSLAISKGLSGLKGFVNGVLRNIARNRDDIKWPDKEKDPLAYLSVVYSMPVWIAKQLCSEYGFERTECMFKAFLCERPVSINIISDDKEELIPAWEKAGINVIKSPYLDNAYMIKDAPGIGRLKGFDEGAFIVQDAGSMLSVAVAGIREGDTVIDLCAAPGGKSMCAAVRCGKSGRVYSYDLSDIKADRIRENADRLKLENMEIAVHDATVYDESLKDKADVVIADLPCSGLGVMGRKADIRYRLKPEDIAALAALQRDILKNAVKYVKPGGLLMYSTCTVSRRENDNNRQWLLDNFDLEAVGFEDKLPKELKNDTAAEGYLQLISGEPEGLPLLDGFFISLYRRKK